MAHPPIFFDPQFVSNVILGYLVTVVGALILLVGGVWWSLHSDSSQQDPPSGAWRALCRAGWAICTPTAAAMPQPMPPLTLPKKLLRSRNAK